MSMQQMIQAARKSKQQMATSENAGKPDAPSIPAPLSPSASGSSSSTPMTAAGSSGPLSVDQRREVDEYLKKGFDETDHSQKQQFTLSQFAISGPSSPGSAYLIPDFISPDEESQLLSHIASSPSCMWHQLKRRRLQMWGGLPQSQQTFTPDPLPKWQEQIIQRIMNTINTEASTAGDEATTVPNMTTGDSNDSMRSTPYFSPSMRPNHVLLNQYLTGEGIFPHQDGPLYHGRVSILSLQSHTIMHFYEQLKHSLPSQHQPMISIYIPPRSLFIFTDELYTRYFHAIEERQEDHLDARTIQNVPKHLDGTTVERQTRISLTIRRVREQ